MPWLPTAPGDRNGCSTANGAAGNQPRSPMQFLSLTLGGKALVGGSSVAKEL